MYTIKAKPITTENFKPYGTFASMLEPTGPSLGDFYNDQVEFPVSGNLPIAFSPLVVHKGEMLVTMAEYHDTTCEGVLPLDDDVVLHVAPATKEPMPELTEAFIVPKGTMVKLKRMRKAKKLGVRLISCVKFAMNLRILEWKGN